MGFLSLTVKKDTEDMIEYRVNISDSDIDRVSRAYASSYFPDTIPTPAEVVEAISKGLVNGILANVTSFEKSEAARIAAEQVNEIQITPGL